MLKYAGKRILILIPIMLMVIFIVYLLLDLAPGNPASIILGETATQEDIDALNEELGYNNPFFVRFFDYIKDLFTSGSFGTSWRTDRDVMGEVLGEISRYLPSGVSGRIICHIDRCSVRDCLCGQTILVD